MKIAAGLGLFLIPLLANVSALTIEGLLAGPPGREIIYKTVEGASLRLHCFTPPDLAKDERRPAVVWIHGGAWVGGTLDGFMPHARYLAARGAVTFNIEYRLMKPEGPSIAECIADCQSAVRFIRTHAAELQVDPRRIAVGGDSAGGHLAAALGILEDFADPADNPAVSARPDALLLFNPVLDLTEGEWIRWAVGGIALADKSSPLPASPAALARARSLSPIFHVKAGAPPALLMHGLEDRVVPWSQAQRLAEALKKAGNRCDLILLEKTGHAFGIAYWKSPEATVVETIRTIDRFLANLGYLKGEPTLVTSPTPAWTPKAPTR